MTLQSVLPPSRRSPVSMSSRLRASAYLLLVLASLFALPAPASPAEPLLLKDQIIQQDTTWSGDILIEGVVVVGRRAKLAITPGTTIRFKKTDKNRDGIGDGELRVLGRLDAQGESGRPIRFESAEPSPEPRDWSYVLLFTAAGKNVVRHCEFRHGFTGLQVHFSTAEVSGCLFTNNNEGIRFGRAKLTVRGNEFKANDTAVRFTRMEGPANLTQNRITGNRIGIFLVPSGQNIIDFFEPDRPGKPWNTGHLSITGNDIHDNLWYNVKLGEKQIWDLDITGNWWGTTDEEGIRATMFARNRDASLGRALFKPFLNTPATKEQPASGPKSLFENSPCYGWLQFPMAASGVKKGPQRSTTPLPVLLSPLPYSRKPRSASLRENFQTGSNEKQPPD